MCPDLPVAALILNRLIVDYNGSCIRLSDPWNGVVNESDLKGRSVRFYKINRFRIDDRL